MNSVDTNYKFITLANKPIEQSLSTEKIVEKISLIDAFQIELIGGIIASKIVDNLGSVNKLKVVEKVMQTKELSTSNKMVLMQARMAAKLAIENGKTQFLSEEDNARFQMTALNPIIDEITDSFSKPAKFLEKGVYFKISEYEPTGLLSDTAKNMGIKITLIDVPTKYHIELTVDKELTKEKSDLVFVLIEESENIEFSKEIFTIGELEKEYNNALNFLS